MSQKRTMYKNEIANLLGVSSNTLRIWLNFRYFEKLKPLGYTKRQKLLTWDQVTLLNNILDFLE